MSRDSFTRYAWIVLAANLGVILWGAYVRASGSGAGCGSTWPTCNGELIPRTSSAETLIEFGHRATSGVALLMVIALGVWAWRSFTPKHPVRRAAAWSVAFMFGEAAIGAGIVLFELVADNASMARAMFMSIHLGNTFLLLAALTLTAYWSRGRARFCLAGQGRLPWLAALALAGTLLIGVSGAVAALGDTLFPISSLGEAVRQDLSPTSHLLIQLRVSHPLIAVIVSLLLLYFVAVVRQDRERRPARRYANLLNLGVVAQLSTGAANIVLLAPVWLQLVHLLLADLVWISLVLTCAASLARGPSGELSNSGEDAVLSAADRRTAPRDLSAAPPAADRAPSSFGPG